MNLTDHIFVKNTEAMLCEILGKTALSEKKVVAGLSGGADSTALVISLFALSKKLGFNLCACHINHMIRGEEADRDEEFSRKLCERYGIPFRCERVDVPALAKAQKKTLEEAARDIRYDFFERVCDKSCGFIATAHTASDNAETILFNIIRGCGVNGLCGIPRKRGNIIRPILFANRVDVEKFLSDINEGFVIDSTNLSDDCTRNIIRHNIIPKIAEINPAFAKSFDSLSILAKRDCDFLDEYAHSIRTNEISVLAGYDIALRSRIIGEMYREKSGAGLPKLHTDMLCLETERAFFEKDGEARSFSLPAGLCARIECGKLYIEDAVSKDDESDLEEYSTLARFGINELCGKRFLAVMSKKAETSEKAEAILEYKQNIYSLFMEAHLFSGIISSILFRSGKGGDKIRISGMSKDIRKMYSAKKIPVSIRKALPRICDGESGEIIALPYVGVCDSQHEYNDMADITIRLYKLTTRSDFTDNEQKK